jgi:hypothetical protein
LKIWLEELFYEFIKFCNYSTPLHAAPTLTWNYKYVPSRGKMLDKKSFNLTTENESAVYYNNLTVRLS